MNIFNIFKKKPSKPKFICSCCGIVYEELPNCLGIDYPNSIFSIPEEERENRIELLESLCIIDQKHFFHRGRITIPIIDYEENLLFDVWTSISEANYNKRMDLWDAPNRVFEEPYFGWLQNSIPAYGETLNIKTISFEQEVGVIPEIKSIEEGHPLTIDQENGISYNRAVEIVNEIMRLQHLTN